MFGTMNVETEINGPLGAALTPLSTVGLLASMLINPQASLSARFRLTFGGLYGMAAHESHRSFHLFSSFIFQKIYHSASKMLDIKDDDLADKRVEMKTPIPPSNDEAPAASISTPKPPSILQPPQSPPSKLHLLDIQQQQNLAREAVSQAAMERESNPKSNTITTTTDLHSKVTIQTHHIHRPIQLSSQSTTTSPHSHPTALPLTARVYAPKPQGYTPLHLPVYLYFHGGGFFTGTLDSEDATCARLVASLYAKCRPIIVVSADYRKTTHVSFPDPFEDAWEVFSWLERRIAWLNGDPTRVVVGGEDAGAALAAWVAWFARSNVAGRREVETRSERVIKVQGLVVCNPWMPLLDRWEEVGEAFGVGSRVMERDPGEGGGKGKGKERARETEVTEVGRGNAAGYDFYHALLNVYRVEPGHHGMGMWTALEAMPDTYLLTFAESLLRRRQLLFATLLMREGVNVEMKVLPGSPHETQDLEILPSSHPWGSELVEALEWCLRSSHGQMRPPRSVYTAGVVIVSLLLAALYLYLTDIVNTHLSDIRP
ncbi:alpha/beta hydrolase [Aspergillus brunneoviolaceus CBS 621.78]|uniref:Alpha/beta-hydrolase n=1 Tax=Aspergillus brunneoviolaceus CBS 621.78 TaxID=1450534 RepID=A0ACD1GHX0_9EURO|nr:alpha/beta-hydrolase [Aspergillus brunneoviolaceus CBS 621.78]RAH48930.1 alpha/beta-hydrolase [Aspergillus brunneoviolaceus CBS 621.78]